MSGWSAKGIWRAEATKVQTKHASRDYTDVSDLRIALGELWLLLEGATSQLQNEFLTISEFDLEAKAKGFAAALRKGKLSWKLGSQLPAIALSIGAQIRALDAVLQERELFFSSLGEADPYLIPELDLFVVPSRSSKSKVGAPGPTATFFRRGAPNHRIFRRRIQGSFDVTVFALPALQTMPEDGILRFGGALIEAEKHSFSKGGLARLNAVSAPDELTQLQSGVMKAFQQPMFIAAWPELSMPEERRNELIEQTKVSFQNNPFQGPRIIAAGSWHDEIDGILRNRMRILDRKGRERVFFDKITRYVGGGIAEANEAGETIPVLLTDAGLVSFAICSDFCVTSPQMPPYLEIDLDFLVVVSLGNGEALKGHEQSAEAIRRKFGTRTFVVQQNDNSGRPLGWVLPKDASLNSETDVPWNLREL